MKGRERPCSIRPQLRSSPNVLRRSVEPAVKGGHMKRSRHFCFDGHGGRRAAYPRRHPALYSSPKK
jgi:hypothetical protein